MLLFCATLLINEVFFDPPGSDAGQEWVEVVNPGPFDVEASGWFLERAKSSWSVRVVFPEGTHLAAGERLLLGDSGAGVDVEAPGGLDLGNASSSGDAVRLVSADGTIVDALVYGPNNDDGFTTPAGQPAWPVFAEGGLLARVPDAVSTGSPADWSSAVEPTPGLPNRERDCDVGRVRLNELFVDPAGADGHEEWVELYGSEDLLLDGWVVESLTRPASTREVALLDGVALSAGEPLLIEGLSGLPNGSGGDAVRLVDCEGTVRDVVVYGDGADDGWFDDTGTAIDPVALGGSGRSLARREDGAHSGVLTDDWWVPELPTPGESNPMPAPCSAGSGLMISELYPDPPGADSGAGEFVELANVGEVPVTLGGWLLRTWTTGDDWTSLPLPNDVVVAPGAVVVVGAGQAIDLPLELPNGRGGDGLWLEDCDGRVVDELAWGSENTDDIPSALGPVDWLAPAPGSGRSLSRRWFSAPSSPEDWEVTQPTPGVKWREVSAARDTLGVPGGSGCASTSSSGRSGGLWLLSLWMVRWRRKT